MSHFFNLTPPYPSHDTLPGKGYTYEIFERPYLDLLKRTFSCVRSKSIERDCGTENTIKVM